MLTVRMAVREMLYVVFRLPRCAVRSPSFMGGEWTVLRDELNCSCVRTVLEAIEGNSIL